MPNAAAIALIGIYTHDHRAWPALQSINATDLASEACFADLIGALLHPPQPQPNLLLRSLPTPLRPNSPPPRFLLSEALHPT